MNVLITGATGFIGCRLCNHFAKNLNNFVYAIVKDENEDVSCLNKSNIKIIYCDLENIVDLCDFLPKNQIDLFYHMAWVGVSTTYKNNFDMQYKNIGYTYRAIELCKTLNIKKFIGIGSISEFAYCTEAIKGDEVPIPSDFYSTAKISSRYFCELFATQNNIVFNWVYITSIYGPGRNDNNVITYTIKSLLKGNTPQYTKLEQEWDYVYIDDVLNALFLVGIKGLPNKTYTIASGVHKPIFEYLNMIKDIINPDAKLEIGVLPYKTNKIDNSVVDISSIVLDTGFKPSMSFEEGIKKTIEFFKNQKED